MACGLAVWTLPSTFSQSTQAPEAKLASKGRGKRAAPLSLAVHARHSLPPDTFVHKGPTVAVSYVPRINSSSN